MLIPITIAPLQQAKVPGMDPLGYPPAILLQVKVARNPHYYDAVCRPAYLPVGTTACTRSPVRKLATIFGRGRYPRGKPQADTFVRRYCPLPRARIVSTPIPFRATCSGVDIPTQRASRACVFGRPRRVRLYLVRPPVPTSTGNPVAARSRHNAQRVELTAAASFDGRRACS